jgi:hypothetical protein
MQVCASNQLDPTDMPIVQADMYRPIENEGQDNAYVLSFYKILKLYFILRRL